MSDPTQPQSPTPNSTPAPLHARAMEAAGVAIGMGDRATAERALRAAIQSIDGMPDDQAETVLVLNDLIRLCLRISAPAMAEPLLLRLLEIKRTKGDEHPEVATVLASLASVRQSMGRHEDAEHLWHRVLDIRERTLAPNHFAIATALEHLAEVCAARGKLAEALQRSQRALAIREATLGADHTSLRTSRERIADLEMQASEDLLPPATPVRPLTPPRGTDLVTGKPAAPARGVPAGAAAPAASRASDPARAPNPVRVSDPARSPETTRTSDPARAAAPARQTTPARSVAMVPSPVRPEAYLRTLEELDADVDPADRPASNRVALWTTTAAFLQHRKRAAAVVGIGVLSLPFAAWGLVGSLRSNEPKWMNWGAEAVAPPVRPEPAPAAVLAGAALTPADSATESGTAKTAGTNAHSPAPEPAAKPPVNRMVAFPTTRRINLTLDSFATPMPVGPEAPVSRLDPAADLARLRSAPPIGAGVRARMIGSLPTPRYPAQQLRGATGGVVRVRFDVDTTGRPVMSTFTVVSTPLPQLANAVKDVIPGVRFEPARTAWPESRPIVETVELTFQFAPTAKR